MQLDQCLFESGTSHLRAVAAFRNIEFSFNPSRAEVIAVLMKRLSGIASDDEVFGSLNEWEKEILFQVSEAGGMIAAGDLEKSWGSDDPEVDRRWFWHKAVSRGLARLRLAGFIFCIRHPDSGEQAYVLPEEFNHLLSMKPIEQIESAYAPFEYVSIGTSILSDIYHMLQYIEEYRVRPLRSGKLAKRHKPIIIDKFDQLTPLDRVRDESYIDLLFSLITELGFIVQRKNGLMVSRRVDDWLSRSRYEQIENLYSVWLDQEEPDDKTVLADLIVHSAGLRHPWRRVKRVLINFMRILPDGWVSFDRIVSLLQIQRPHFYRSRHAHGLWQLTERATRASIPSEKIWDNLERRVLIYLLTGPLTWMGLVDLGKDQEGRWEGFVISPIGRAVINGDSGRMPDDTGETSTPLNRIIIQSDFDVLAPAGIVLSVRNRLERIAQLVSGGHVQRYHISRETIAAALESGLTSGDIIQFLETNSSAPLPQNVRTSILDWIGEFGKIEIREGMAVLAEDEYILQNILSHPATGRLVGDRIGPRAAWLDGCNCEELVNELKRIGYLPRVRKLRTGGVASISLLLDTADAEYLFALLNDRLEQLHETSDRKSASRLEMLLERLEKTMAD